MGIIGKKLLQRWAGLQGSAVDGIIGPQTREAVRACARKPSDYLQLRWEYYQTRPEFKTFGAGWKNRLKEVAKFAGIKW